MAWTERRPPRQRWPQCARTLAGRSRGRPARGLPSAAAHHRGQRDARHRARTRSRGHRNGPLTARSGRFAAAKAHAYTHSGGAGETGLARVTELHASHTAGDTIMTLALAGTLFFNPQTAQARSEVATFLLLTMVPFVLVAPLIGPLLDRFSTAAGGPSARRWRSGPSSAGCSARRSPTTAAGSSPPRSAASSRPGPTPSPGPPPSRACCRRARPSSRPTRACRWPGSSEPSSAARSAASRCSPVRPGRSGSRSSSSSSARSRRSACRSGSTPRPARCPSRTPPRSPSASHRRAPTVTTSWQPTPHATPRTLPAPSSLRGTQRGWSGWPATTAYADGRRHAHRRLARDLSAGSGGASRRSRGRSCTRCGRPGGTRVLTGFLIIFMAFLAKEHPIDGMRGEVVLALVVVAIGVGNALGSVVGNVVRDQRPERIAMVSVLAATVMLRRDGHLVRRLDPRPARPRPGPLGAAVQAVLRRPRAARGARERPHVGLRVVRDDAPGALGRRRHPRHRAAAQPLHRLPRLRGRARVDRRHGGPAAPPRHAARTDRERDVPDGRAVAPPAGDPRRTRRPRRAARPRGGPDRALPVLPYAADGPPPPCAAHDAEPTCPTGSRSRSARPARPAVPSGRCSRRTRSSGRPRATHQVLGGSGAWLLAMPAHHIAGLQVLLRSRRRRGRPRPCSTCAAASPRARFAAAAPGPPDERGRAALHGARADPAARLVDDPAGVAALRGFDGVLVGGAATPPALVERARALGVVLEPHLRHERDGRRLRLRRLAAARQPGPRRQRPARRPRRRHGRPRLPRRARA